MEAAEFLHRPVLLGECIEALQIIPCGLYADGTAGGAGHAAAIAERLNADMGGHLYAFDQDPEAANAACIRLRGLAATVIKANFRRAAALLMGQGVMQIDGALLDLGVSSYQLDNRSRGFSYHSDARENGCEAPLDMRMSQSGTSAADLVNALSRQELADIFRLYGEERYAWQIAGKIETERRKAPILTAGRMAETVLSALPAAERRKAKNPARKVFQALRIAVNDEMGALGEGLDSLFGILKPGGRLAVISFHSLEDRVVKQRFREWATACTCPPDFPVCRCAGAARGRLVYKAPLCAGADELLENRRSRSAKLRVIEKL